jgi:calcineurin-like phosphoesterase family protein
MIYLTADWHLNHVDIIEWCNRPFEDCEHMEKEIINRYLSMVSNSDDVIFLGDIFWNIRFNRMKSILETLPGNKYLAKGNHDTYSSERYAEVGFKKVRENCIIHAEEGCITVNDRDFMILTNSEENIKHDYYLYHDPANSQMNRDKRYICGHIHDLFIKQKNVINVGVDVWDYCPVSLLEIENIFDEKGLLNSL